MLLWRGLDVLTLCINWCNCLHSATCIPEASPECTTLTTHLCHAQTSLCCHATCLDAGTAQPTNSAWHSQQECGICSCSGYATAHHCLGQLWDLVHEIAGLQVSLHLTLYCPWKACREWRTLLQRASFVALAHHNSLIHVCDSGQSSTAERWFLARKIQLKITLVAWLHRCSKADSLHQQNSMRKRFVLVLRH